MAEELAGALPRLDDRLLSFNDIDPNFDDEKTDVVHPLRRHFALFGSCSLSMGLAT